MYWTRKDRVFICFRISCFHILQVRWVWHESHRKHSSEDQVQGITSQAKAENEPSVHECCVEAKVLCTKQPAFKIFSLLFCFYVSDHRKYWIAHFYYGLLYSRYILRKHFLNHSFMPLFITFHCYWKRKKRKKINFPISPFFDE